MFSCYTVFYVRASDKDAALGVLHPHLDEPSVVEVRDDNTVEIVFEDAPRSGIDGTSALTTAKLPFRHFAYASEDGGAFVTHYSGNGYPIEHYTETGSGNLLLRAPRGNTINDEWLAAVTRELEYVNKTLAVLTAEEN